MFKDRAEAGKKITHLLENYRGTNAVILALPRGGVVTGAEVAGTLNLPLDLIFVKKIGHPFNPEYAVCAVSENQDLVCNEDEMLNIDQEWLEREIEKKVTEAVEYRRMFLEPFGHINLKDKIAIIVDDGIATGLTMKSAILWVKKEKPKKILVAVPVLPVDIKSELEEEGIDVIACEIPALFLGSVGAYYENFDQVDNETVVKIFNPFKYGQNLPKKSD